MALAWDNKYQPPTRRPMFTDVNEWDAPTSVRLLPL